MVRFLSLLACFLVLFIPVQAHAQSDEGRLVRFLEEQLSDGAARQIQIEGFRGALSSTAELDRLTIADAQGVWLTLENAQLNWSRLAVLRGNLQIDEITATRLIIARAPVAEDDGLNLPDAEATPFSLPELPLSVAIDRAAIDEVVLGEALLGFEVRLSVEGQAQLADGDGAAALTLLRLDGPRGVFDLDANYSNQSRQLALSLMVEEDEGGLAAELLNLPGRPSIDLSIEGTGPIDAFTANIDLSTDGEERLTGAVTTVVAAETGVRSTIIGLQGDISPLLVPQYRGFFGNDVALDARVRQLADGGVVVDTLSLTSRALALAGDLELAPDGRPVRFELTGRIADPTGAVTRLPIPNADVQLAIADLVMRYDAEASDAFDARVLVGGLVTEGFEIGRLDLDAGGMIAEEANGIAVVSDVRLDVTELGADDPALATAIGSDVQLTAQISWLQGAPLIVSNLSLQAGDVMLAGSAAATFGDAALDLTGDLTANVADLSRFGPVSGLPLRGQIAADLRGSTELLSGAFSGQLSGRGQDLFFVDALSPALTAGETQLEIEATRDETGLELSRLILNGTQIDLSANGSLSSASSSFRAEADLANVGLLTSQIQGPASIDLTMTQTDGAPWQANARVAGPNGISANVSGAVGMPGGAVNITATGRFPLALATPLLRPRSITGNGSFDLTVQGQPSLNAVRGQITATGIQVALPNLQSSLQGGTAEADIANGRVTFTTNANLATGGTVSADGSVNIGAPSLPATISVTGRSLRLTDPTLYNALVETVDLRVTGALLGSMNVAGDINLGETELRVPETGLGVSAIPDIDHTGETAPERRTRENAGLLGTSGGGDGSQRIGLDITVNAPGRVFIRGRGLDAELGGSLRLSGTTANTIPSGQFDLIRGRFVILGTRLDLTEGAAFLQGSFDPFVRLVATSRSGEYTILITISGLVTAPEVTFSSDPILPEDEVLAQLLFGRSISALSPLQLLQMADAVASLVGGDTNGGLIAGLRDNLGLDDLDLETDEQGNAAVRAGRYLSENVYADVTVGSDETDLSLNIDLSPSVTARGTFSSDGNSSIGLFFERDY